MSNAIIPYNPRLKILARELRKQRVLSEVLLWQKLKGRSFGVEFHRQVPMLEYIVDFYCHELMLVIEVDGLTHDFEDVLVKDGERQREIEAYGVHFLRFASNDILNGMSGVVLTIEAKIEELRKSY
ncbi:MAG: endonuclease protein [Flavipsychrobacter sp.]|jgi:very-short-patch-repair endonuclease|nr:endonuclease protein [Flavipsychrobacter sp.]